MSETFLTPQEVRVLTGTTIKARQAQQLRAQGLPFWLNVRNEPVVPRAALTGAPSAPAPQVWEPTPKGKRHGQKANRQSQPA